MEKDLPKMKDHCRAETSTACPSTLPQPLVHGASVLPAQASRAMARVGMPSHSADSVGRMSPCAGTASTSLESPLNHTPSLLRNLLISFIFWKMPSRLLRGF